MRARTQNKRLWLAGGATMAVVTVLIGWFGVIQPELSAASADREQAASDRLQNSLLEAKNSKLKAQDDATTLRAGLVAALAELPSDDGLPAFTRQLSAQAAASSVVLSSMIVGAATPVVAAPAETDTAITTDTQATSTSDASSGALVQLTITVTAVGPGPDLQAFLEEVLVTGPRRVLVTESQLTPVGDVAGGIDGPCSLSLTLKVFSAPLSATDQAALEKLLSEK